MLKQRVITATIIAIALLLALYSLTAFQLTVLFAAVLGWASWEWSDLSGFDSLIGRLAYTAVMIALIVLLGLHAGLPEGINSRLIETVSLTAILWWLIAFALIRTYPASAYLWQPVWVRSFIGFLVLLPPWLAVSAILYRPDGVSLFLLVVLTVVLADVGAYFAGKQFGKNKLAQRVSPGKTWEGVLGGVLVNLLFVVFLLLVLDVDSGQHWLFVLVMLPALLSVIGDLLESMMKRNRGIKDSGHILPGHGGILDRIDGFTVSLPAFVFVLEMSGLQF